MKCLFRNTSLDAFTPVRSEQLLEGFESLKRHLVSCGLSSSIECLADALHELEYEDKHHCLQLFASADILWALARDGVCIADAIEDRGGFLYDFHNDTQLHEENRKTPLMGLAEMGLQYIAIQVDGITHQHKKQAAKELVKALLEAGKKLKYAHTVKMVSAINYYRLMLFAEIEFYPNKGDDELYYQLSCSLPLNKRTTDQNKKTFLALFDETLLHLNKNYTNIAVEMAIAEDFIQSMVYDQVAAMWLNGLNNKEILQTCEFAIDSILALSPVSELNAIIFQRYMLINACLPFQDLLQEIGVNDFELSMGLELPESDSRGFTRQFIGANFNYLYGPRREDFTNALCKKLKSFGYAINFTTLCNNNAVTNTTISTMMNRENGCPAGISDLLGQRVVPINVLTTLLNEINLSVVTPEILSSLAIHCLNSVQDNSFLEGRYKRFFQRWDERCGVKWKSLLLQSLDVAGKVTPELCALLNANGQHLKDIQNPTPAIKRVLLNHDIGLDI